MTRILNYDADPKCMKARPTGSSPTVEKQSNGWYKYSASSVNPEYAIYTSAAWLDSVVFIGYLSSVEPGLLRMSRIAGAAPDANNIGWIVGKVTGDKPGLIASKPLILRKSAVYTFGGWQRIKAMYDAGDYSELWFASNIMPIIGGGA